MSITRLSNGRYRAQVYVRGTGETVSVGEILGLPKGERSWASKREAKAAREKARAILDARQEEQATITVRAWSETWTTSPLYQRKKESTNITNRHGIALFVREHGDMPIKDVTRDLVIRFLQPGKRNHQVMSLRPMFNDAVQAGHITSNPFSNLKLPTSRGNAEKDPPTLTEVDTLIRCAGEQVSPWFESWLEVACFTGMRPGELDALKWRNVDLVNDRVHVVEQLSAHTGTYTLPKNGQTRTIVLTPRAKAALLRLPRPSEFCFVNLNGQPFGAGGRTYPWAKTRAAAGVNKSLYLCSRHFCGSFLVNELGMESEDAAIQLGHTDGGELVRKLYGHRDRNRALSRLDAAFSAHQTVHQAPLSPEIPQRSAA